MNKKTIDDLNLNNKKVLIRLDLNVPIKNGIIQNDERIIKALPTIKKAIQENAKLILFSHLGRVKTEEDKIKNNLEIVAKDLSKKLDQEVIFVNATRGKELEDKINNLEPGQIILVQNTRYEDLNNKAESGNNPELAKYWASLGDIFINDAFGTSHRSHASNVGIATFSKETAIGYLVKEEVEQLSKCIVDPQRPFVVILGGAKVSDKVKVIEHLLPIADKLIIGGGMAFTFSKANNFTIGDSLVEEDFVNKAKELLEKYSSKIVLPIDFAISNSFADNDRQETENQNIPDGYMGLDIGSKSIELFKETINGSKTVMWNGPVGVFEFNNFKKGTIAMAQTIGELENAFKVVGGGDSVSAVINLGFAQNFSHISTGGGASLEFLEGIELPGIKVIQDK